jgi:hypothetical protein
MSNIPAAEPPVQEMPHACAYTAQGKPCGRPAAYRLNTASKAYLCAYHYSVLLNTLRTQASQRWFEDKD